MAVGSSIVVSEISGIKTKSRLFPSLSYLNIIDKIVVQMVRSGITKEKLQKPRHGSLESELPLVDELAAIISV